MPIDCRVQASCLLCWYAGCAILDSVVKRCLVPPPKRLQDSHRETKIQPPAPRITECTGRGRPVDPLFFFAGLASGRWSKAEGQVCCADGAGEEV